MADETQTTSSNLNDNNNIIVQSDNNNEQAKDSTTIIITSNNNDENKSSNFITTNADNSTVMMELNDILNINNNSNGKSANNNNSNRIASIPFTTELNKFIQKKLKRKKKIPNPIPITATTTATITAIDADTNDAGKINHNNNDNDNSIKKLKIKTDNQLNNDNNNNNKNQNENEDKIIKNTCDMEEIAMTNKNILSTSNDPDCFKTVVVVNETAAISKSSAVIVTKPPLPPSKIPAATKSSVAEMYGGVKIPPPRLKRKLDEQNASMVQKLNACTEQLRLEITDLKMALNNERNAVRMLRAQYEAEIRKSKMEIKKLQSSIEFSKKTAAANANQINSRKSKIESLNSNKDSSSGIIIGSGDGGVSDHQAKLFQEITSLKEANRTLEEKIQILNNAERRKISDIRELKDSYENRLTQISKSAKTEINRLLEEIKAKERNIGQLKKEINTLKNAVLAKKDMMTSKRNAQHPNEMKKLKDIERINHSNINNTDSNQKCNTTTCDRSDFHEMSHDITERIIESHDDSQIYRNKNVVANSSDTDSAVSSAPQSISPQPPTNGIAVTEGSTDIWQSVKNYSNDTDILQKANETLQKENENLKMELDTAKQQINKFEKIILEANKNNHKMQQLIERIQYLEQKEDILLKESHELREQNELLEFRIIELEESNEKWSLRGSSTNPDTRDMWTDTEQKSDNILMYTSDHTDSGVTSPHSQHHIDDRNINSPCDLSLMDHTSNDEIKRRLSEITKRSYVNDEDKICLLQVLTLINNLEAISDDSILINDELLSLDLTKSKASDYGSDSSSSPRSISISTTASDIQFQQKIPKNNYSSSSRIVATVLPYSSTLSTPTDTPKKLRNWNSNSLQESGVFEGDALDTSCNSQSTQTEPEDFVLCTTSTGSTTPTADLCAEIQKLNKFREKIEECATKSSSSSTSSTVTQSGSSKTTSILSPNLSDQRRLQYYKDRLELLENKLLIYESSGDIQTKRLAERLQREIKLDALVKELQQKVESLEVENLRLEEEKCEFEEAENDTRLRLQKLEIDLEILNQRNIELEMSREAVQNKLKEANSQCNVLQDAVKDGKEKIKNLEDDSKDLKNRLNLIKTSMPAILLFNSLMVNSNKTKLHNDTENSAIVASKYLSNNEYSNKDYYLENKVQELLTREKELTQSITELNRAYHETLENADNLWVQIEKEYKDRLSVAEATENQLKAKITQLEERLNCNTQFAQERIIQLEESECNLQHRITKLLKENKDLTLEHENVLKECNTLKDELAALKDYIAGPIQDNIDKEKLRVRSLEEDLNVSNNLLSEVEHTYRSELQTLKSKLNDTTKELLNIEVTNAELKEEVITLEKEIVELQKQRDVDEEKIRNLTDELRTKEEILIQLTAIKSRNRPIQSLAQELETNMKTAVQNSKISFQDDHNAITDEINTVQMKLREALNKAETRGNNPQCENLMKMTQEVQNLSNIVQNKNEIDLELKDESIQTEEKILKSQATSPRLSSSENLLIKETCTSQSFNTLPCSSNTSETCKNNENSIQKSNRLPVKKNTKLTSMINNRRKRIIKTYVTPSGKSILVTPNCQERASDNDNEKMFKSKVIAAVSPSTDKMRNLSSQSAFTQFRSVMSQIKSKLFFDSTLTDRQRDYACKKCLNLILSNEMNERQMTDVGTNTENDENVATHSNHLESRHDSYSNSSIFNQKLHTDSCTRTVLIKSLSNEKHGQTTNTVIRSSSIRQSKNSLEKQTECIIIDSNKLPQVQNRNYKNSYNTSSTYDEPINLKKILDISYPKISNIDFFISLIREELHHSRNDKLLLEKENCLQQLYEINEIFKNDLDLSLELGCKDWPHYKSRKVKNCQDVVRVMACMRKVKIIYAPYKISILKLIEDEVTDKLLMYYCNSRRPKLYCPVYSPIVSSKIHLEKVNEVPIMYN